MHRKYKQYEDQFYALNQEMKLNNIPAIVSALLGQSLPFSNLGVMHPLLQPFPTLDKACNMMENNLE